MRHLISIRTILATLLICNLTGCLAVSYLPEKLQQLLPSSRRVRAHEVQVSYVPGLMASRQLQLPPLYMLVLRPSDRRSTPRVRSDRIHDVNSLGELGAIIGFSGWNFEEGYLTIAPNDTTRDLGQLREMDAGMPYLPDIPKTLFHVDRLLEKIQYALTLHLRGVGIETEMLPFSLPEPLTMDAGRPGYALGCVIDDFSLYSLQRYKQIRLGTRRISLPIRGPTRASISFSFSLYELPTGKVAWHEQVWTVVHDPARGRAVHSYGTADDLMTVALSQAIGQVIYNAQFQSVLSRGRGAARHSGNFTGRGL